MSPTKPRVNNVCDLLDNKNYGRAISGKIKFQVSKVSDLRKYRKVFGFKKEKKEFLERIFTHVHNIL